MSATGRPRRSWDPIIARAAEIVRSYDIPVTLRQLFYRLVSEGLIPNETTPYNQLSYKTAEFRRKGEFPPLFDRGRSISQPNSWSSATAGLAEFVDHHFRLDRTAGQDMSIWLVVEKNALAGLIEAWFEDYGVPVVALGGYGSQSIEADVIDQVDRDGRPAVLIIAGDFDASGMDITRHFLEKTDCWEDQHRIGLSVEQVESLRLPVLVGKCLDARSQRFIERYRDLHERHAFTGRCLSKGCRGGHGPDNLAPVQVELDAVPPDTLHRWFTDVLDEYMDMSSFELVKEKEARQRAEAMIALGRLAP